MNTLIHEFHELQFNPCLDGVQAVQRFDNNYGVSVVQHNGSYGGKQGFYEVAVIQYNDKGGWRITYDTPVTTDVVGWLLPTDVTRIMNEVAALS